MAAVYEADEDAELPVDTAKRGGNDWVFADATRMLVKLTRSGCTSE